jgi:hypothetical protein
MHAVWSRATKEWLSALGLDFLGAVAVVPASESDRYGSVPSLRRHVPQGTDRVGDYQPAPVASNSSSRALISCSSTATGNSRS